ncbi:hypothetical protein FSARC_6226 [Fusarium sarcochroum]|uniref:Mating type protein 1-1-2 n=1 Tax=Fusarium sarcochroum TaxID=1208366 RepID=A0A8H4TXV0_9HYPO|nr:hypothetical protein FSARC_6226 [Fusarium sarcochroum]
MDSAFSFSPLWEEEALINKPERALDALHAKVLGVILRSIPLPSSRGASLSKQEILRAVIFVIAQVLPDLADDNEVLAKIRATSAKLAPAVNPSALIDGTIVLWYIQAVFVIWQHHQGRRQASGPGLPFPWAAGYGNDNYPVANLGFMTMLRGASSWSHPKHPKLQHACLISQATMSVLYAVYTIGPLLKDFPWRHLEIHIPPARAYELFLKVSVTVSGNIYSEGKALATPPAFEYGVTLEDVRMSRCGKKLLTKVYEDEDWRRVPYWHPYLKFPGSPWNNYIKNSLQPTFSTGSKQHKSGMIKWKLPSTTTALAGLFKARYAAIRTNLDDVNTEIRPKVSDLERLRQHYRLAQLTGRKYAAQSPSEATAHDLDDIVDDYLYHTPAVQKPRADSGGYLTLPFMSTAVHAYQILEDPEEPGDDFFTMNFEQYLD